MCELMATLCTSKLQIFEPPVKMARKSLCVAPQHNLREILPRSRLKAFWFFFLKKNVFHRQTNLINQNPSAPPLFTQKPVKQKKEDLLQALNIFSISQKDSLVNPKFYFRSKVLPIVQKPPQNFKHNANCIS